MGYRGPRCRCDRCAGLAAASLLRLSLPLCLSRQTIQISCASLHLGVTVRRQSGHCRELRRVEGTLNMARGAIILTAGFVFLAGCTPPTQHPVAISGSKSDATVTMAAEYSPNGVAPNWATADETARERCEAWGYTGAEPLGSRFSTCTQFGAYGTCQRTRETVTYQCLGGTTTTVQ